MIIEALIFWTISYGASTPIVEGETISKESFLKLLFIPKTFKTSCMYSTSSIKGTFLRRYFPSASMGRIISFNTAFLAPFTFISPLNLWLPSIEICFSTIIDIT